MVFLIGFPKFEIRISEIHFVTKLLLKGHREDCWMALNELAVASAASG